MIVLKDVNKEFGKKREKSVHALKNINVTIKQGEIFGFVGFSGAGKSTLLRSVNLLERPTSGEVLIRDINMMKLTPKELRKQRKKIGMIFQQYNLLHAKNIFQNVAMPLVLEKWPKDKIEKRVKELLAFVGLEDRADHFPEQLSGGQKQRVGIARALATNPDILLCDEATSALDPNTTEAVLELLRKVRDEFGVTILIITHEMNVIKDMCDRVAVMENGEIVEQGTVIDVFTEPQTEITESFVKTVLNSDIPKSIRKVIEAQSESDDARFYRVIFKGHSTGSPLLSETAKKFDVHINVVHGMITELQEIPFGNLIVNISGDQKEAERAIAYMLSQEVVIRQVD